MKHLLYLILLLTSCSKSGYTPAIQQRTTKVTVVSAEVTANGLDVKINIVGASLFNKLNLVIYKTDITGTSWKYPIPLTEGDQHLICANYSDKSPANYQIENFDVYGNGHLSDLMTVSY